MKKIISLIVLLVCSHAASAGVIRSAVSATASSEFSSSYNIVRAINQSGLSSGYVSGVDNFATYMATNPTHTPSAANNEWFTASGVRSAVATFDLGSLYSLSGAALWVEESWASHSGVSFLVSSNGVDFTSVMNNLTLADHPLSDYPATVYNFAAVNARYFQIAFGNCAVDGCSLGEIAFNTADATSNTRPVPAPMSGALLLTGLAGLYFSRKNRSAK